MEGQQDQDQVFPALAAAFGQSRGTVPQDLRGERGETFRGDMVRQPAEVLDRLVQPVVEQVLDGVIQERKQKRR